MAFSRTGGTSGSNVDREPGEPPPTDVYGCDVYAASLSPFDINAAISTLGAGGGTVCLPAGTGTFNPPTDAVGIAIPYLAFPLTIHGEGIGVTTLQETVNSGNSTMFRKSWTGQNYSAAAVRFTGISFKGFVDSEATTTNVALDLRVTTDFRIDNCSFEDFANQAVFLSGDTGGTYKLINRGLIDHCSFDNPYKDLWQPHGVPAPWAVWGYGIIIVGNYMTAAWDPDISHYLGKYYNATTFGGYDIPNNLVYVEDCTFDRCRHAIDSNGGGYYVARHNTFHRASPYGQCCVHGATPGGRGFECYDNIYDFSDESYSLGQDEAHEPRGGSGVITDEDVEIDLTYATKTVKMQDDGEPAAYNISQLYIWDNTAMDDAHAPINFEAYIDDNGYVEDTDYFLRAPTVVDDGFTFTKYTYPHPLI